MHENMSVSETKQLSSLIPLDGKYSIKGYLLANYRITDIWRCNSSELEFCCEQCSNNDISDNLTLKKSLIYNKRPNEIICNPVLNEVRRNKKTMYKNLRRYPIDPDQYSIQSNQSSDDERYIEIGRYSGRIPRMRSDQSPCQYLNQFSSVFVDNLKDPIPKDPLRRPRAYNNYSVPAGKRSKSTSNNNSNSSGKKKNLSNIGFMVDEDQKPKHKLNEPCKKPINGKRKNCRAHKEEKVSVRFCCLPCFI